MFLLINFCYNRLFNEVKVLDTKIRLIKDWFFCPKKQTQFVETHIYFRVENPRTILYLAFIIYLNSDQVHFPV